MRVICWQVLVRAHAVLAVSTNNLRGNTYIRTRVNDTGPNRPVSFRSDYTHGGPASKNYLPGRRLNKLLLARQRK